MRGFVPTPSAVVDLMVARLFDGQPPTKNSTILDPGCGPGAFEDGIVRWCQREGLPLPRITGVESEPRRHRAAADRLRVHPSITIVKEDFLASSERRFDYVVGNPPYVSITHLSETEKRRYRHSFESAQGRFDLYMLFFEQALPS